MNRASQFQTPLSLFHQGLDTADIAAHLGCSEATAYNLIHKEREKRRKFKRIKYAGAEARGLRIRQEMREARAGA